MDHFYIITNEKKDPGLEFTKQLMAFLEENGRKCTQINTKTDGEKNRIWGAMCMCPMTVKQQKNNQYL